MARTFKSECTTCTYTFRRVYVYILHFTFQTLPLRVYLGVQSCIVCFILESRQVCKGFLDLVRNATHTLKKMEVHPLLNLVEDLAVSSVPLLLSINTERLMFKLCTYI